MIIGTHAILYTKDAEADRAFLRDVLGWSNVDAGGGWLIFKLPPAEAAIHPANREAGEPHADRPLAEAVLYLMCDDVKGLVASLTSRGVRCAKIEQESWGLRTTIPLPSGAQLGLYQPTHPTAIGL